MTGPSSCPSPLTEAEVTALADGAIAALSVGAIEHAEACAACSARVADEALLAASVGSALRALASDGAAEAARDSVALGVREPGGNPSALAAGAGRPASPTKPILIALLVAALASAPLASSFARTSIVLLGAGRVYREAIWQALTAVAGSVRSPVWTSSAAIGLLGLSVLVARWAYRTSNHGSVEGEAK